MLYILSMADVWNPPTQSLRFLEKVSELCYCNPFSAKRVELEREILKGQFDESESNWNIKASQSRDFKNIDLIIAKIEFHIEPFRLRLLEARPGRAESGAMDLYEDAVFFVLYHRYRAQLLELIEEELVGRGKALNAVYDGFVQDAEYFFGMHPQFSTEALATSHLFALAFQIARAFYHIYQYMIGVSAPMQGLRARVWESIFTCDLKRYCRTLYCHLTDVTTLIHGPSGTGKELVARAVGLSRYLPFDEKRKSFSQNFSLSFWPLQLSAYPSTLIESELFGHSRGAFTGAVADRKGWLELSGRYGTVFLDEIGEIEHSIQVKLLRVLESRQFQRLGDNRRLLFQGKLIAATNRDLSHEIERNAFRPDLYYRLCSDQIITPGLHERLQDNPSELESLIPYLMDRMIPGTNNEKIVLSMLERIETTIPSNYHWPGNVRELEQCLRNLLIHGEYIPQARARSSSKVMPEGLESGISRCTASADELLDWYCAYAYDRLGNYEEIGRRLGLDRRTVKARAQKVSSGIK